VLIYKKKKKKRDLKTVEKGGGWRMPCISSAYRVLSPICGRRLYSEGGGHLAQLPGHKNFFRHLFNPLRRGKDLIYAIRVRGAEENSNKHGGGNMRVSNHVAYG